MDLESTIPPSPKEALILIGAALAFSHENWEQFAKESEMGEDGQEEIKTMVQYLDKTIHDKIDEAERMERAMEIAVRVFRH